MMKCYPSKLENSIMMLIRPENIDFQKKCYSL